MSLGGKSSANAMAQIWGCAQGGNARGQAYQGVGEWGNRAVGDGERITRHIEALSIPCHVAYVVIGSYCP